MLQKQLCIIMQQYRVVKPSQQIVDFEIMSITSCTCRYCQTAHNTFAFAHGQQVVPILAKSMYVFACRQKDLL